MCSRSSNLMLLVLKKKPPAGANVMVELPRSTYRYSTPTDQLWANIHSPPAPTVHPTFVVSSLPVRHVPDGATGQATPGARTSVWGCLTSPTARPPVAYSSHGPPDQPTRPRKAPRASCSDRK